MSTLIGRPLTTDLESPPGVAKKPRPITSGGLSTTPIVGAYGTTGGNMASTMPSGQPAPAAPTSTPPGSAGPSLAIGGQKHAKTPTMASVPAGPPTAAPPLVPTSSGFLSSGAQDLIDQYVRNTQQQGSQELQRQLTEDLLPSLKAAAAANGQVNNDGTVNGAFLENLTRQQGQVGRELANIVLGAQTQGLDKSLEQGRFEAGQSLTREIESARNDLTRLQITTNAGLEQQRIALQDKVATGQLSLGQATLEFERARAETDAAVKQQQLRIQMMELLGGQQLEETKFATGTIMDALGRQRSDISMLGQLGGQDFAELIDAIQATKAGGMTTRQSGGGDVLGDVLGTAMAVKFLV